MLSWKNEFQHTIILWKYNHYDYWNLGTYLYNYVYFFPCLAVSPTRTRLTMNYIRLFLYDTTTFLFDYRKFPKYSDTQKICCNHSKIWTLWLYHRVMSRNDADGMANSVDPDQTAVWSGSALFAQTCLSENLGSRYVKFSLPNVRVAIRCALVPIWFDSNQYNTGKEALII